MQVRTYSVAVLILNVKGDLPSRLAAPLLAFTGIRDPYFLPPPFFLFARRDFDTIVPGGKHAGGRRSPAQWRRFGDNKRLRLSLLRGFECERGISCPVNGQLCKLLNATENGRTICHASALQAAQNATTYALAKATATPSRSTQALRLNTSTPRLFRFIPRLDPPPAGEPCCGAPLEQRRPACESWCASSPLASFVATLTAEGHGCWDAASSSAPPQTQQQQRPRLRLLYTGWNGLSDSLAGAVSALYIAALAGAEFHMRFSADPSEARLEWAYDTNCVNALLSPEEWPDEDAIGGTTRLSFSYETSKKYGAPTGVLDAVTHGDVRSLWAGNATLMLHTHTGFVRLLLQNPLYATRLAAAGVTQRNAFPEAFHFLLRPRAAALARYSEALHALTTGSRVGSVSVHIRVGDWLAFTRNTSGRSYVGVRNVADFFVCARQVSLGLARVRGLGDDDGDGITAVQWLLLSDSAKLRADVARHWRLAADVVPLPPNVSVMHSRARRGKRIPGNHIYDFLSAQTADCYSFLDGAMEHWLFGLADAYVVTRKSGYGRTAALLHDSGGPIFQLPRWPMKPNQKRTSEPVNCKLDMSGSAVDESLNAAFLEDVLEEPPGLR